MKNLLILVALVALGACSNSEKLAACRGPAFVLNTGHWAPSPADLQVAKPGKAE
jgi:hypothetical protein